MGATKINLIISLLIFFIVILACGNLKQKKPEVVEEKKTTETTTSKDSSQNPSTTNTQNENIDRPSTSNNTKENTTEHTTSKSTENEEDIFKIGQKVKLGDFTLVVKTVSECNSSNPFIKPDAGKKFISVDITVENVGSQPRDYNFYFFRLQDDQDFTYAPGIFPCEEPAFNYGVLQKNQKSRGYLTFEIPIRNKPFQLIYTPSWWTKGQILINLLEETNVTKQNIQNDIEELAIINDPDGFTNIRSGPSIDFDIVGKVLEGENFYVKPKPSKQWWQVRTQNGISGYMHKSKIKLLSNK